jgi:hypothetical protein
MKRGDFVQLTCEGRTIDAMVTLAGNGAAILMFEGIVAGCAGALPIQQKDDGSWCALMTGTPLEIVPRKEEP